MPFDLTPGAVIGLASGIVTASVGVAVLAAVRPRTHASWAFALFALLWGGQVAVANVAQLAADAQTALPWFRLSTLLVLHLPLPLLYFAAAFPTQRPAWPTHRAALIGATAVSAGLGLLYLGAPDLLGGVVDGPSGRPQATFGPLYVPVFAWSLLGAFVLVLAVLQHRLARARGRVARGQLALVTAAFLAYVAYRSAEVVEVGLLNAPSYLARLGPAAFALRLAFYGVGCAAVAVTLGRAARDRTTPWRELILVCGSVPFAFGALEAVVVAAGVTGYFTVGLWRLLMVGLFAYAIARYGMFDVELRLLDRAGKAAFAASCVVVLAILVVVLGDRLARAPGLAVLATLGTAAACAPLLRVARDAAGTAAPALAEPGRLYQRKVEVYRAALEEARARRGASATGAERLADLRRRLGITEEEHRVLSALVALREGLGRASDRFTVERELGRGSEGKALLAFDRRLERRVVLKVPAAAWTDQAHARPRFLREAKLAARIQHPNIVAVHEVLPDEEPPLMVLEYVDGGSLEDRLRARGRLPPGEAARLALDVLSGLEHLHRAGIVHRDLKPGNILLTREGTAKITDFGVATPPRDLAASRTPAEAGAVGSLAYMSPEQARGEEVDHRADLYSTGAVLFEALTGRSYLPFQSLTEADAMRKIERERPDLSSPAAVPRPLVPVLAKALEKRRDRRYAGASAMARAIHRAMPGLQEPAAPARAR